MCGSMVDIQSATAENRRGKKKELECGPIPNVMAALANVGGALCESSVIPFLVPRRKFWKLWLTSVERHRCSNEASMKNALKFAGVPQTTGPI